MRASKIILIIVFITAFALLYVWQQTEIFRFAYVGQKNFTAFQDLLDKNTILRYNINKNASLVSIGSKVSDNLTFQMPDAYRLVRLAYSKENIRLANQAPRNQSLAARIFGIKRQAEARTLNP